MQRLGDGFGVAGENFSGLDPPPWVWVLGEDAGGSAVLLRLSCDVFFSKQPVWKVVVRNCSKFRQTGRSSVKGGGEQAVAPTMRRLRSHSYATPPFTTPHPPSIVRMHFLLKRIGSWEAHTEPIICLNLVEDPPSVLTSAMDRLVKVLGYLQNLACSVFFLVLKPQISKPTPDSIGYRV